MTFRQYFRGKGFDVFDVSVQGLALGRYVTYAATIVKKTDCPREFAIVVRDIIHIENVRFSNGLRTGAGLYKQFDYQQPDSFQKTLAFVRKHSQSTKTRGGVDRSKFTI